MDVHRTYFLDVKWESLLKLLLRGWVVMIVSNMHSIKKIYQCLKSVFLKGCLYLPYLLTKGGRGGDSIKSKGILKYFCIGLECLKLHTLKVVI